MKKMMPLVLKGLVLLCYLPLVLALPIVESRTGEPRVRQPGAYIEEGAAADPTVSSTFQGMPLRPDTHHSRPIKNDDHRLPGPLKVQEINALQEELQELRGTLEKQLHQLEEQLGRIKKSQQDLYLDIDKRLKQVETQKPKAIVKKAVSGVDSPSLSEMSVATPMKPKAVAVPVPEPVAETAAQAVTPSSAGRNNEFSEKEAYDAAAAHLSAKELPEAIQGFEAFIERYPQGQQSAQAYYWLGEAYMNSFESNRTDKSLLDKAAQAFLVVTTRFPTHQRATDALLKLGMVEQEKGNKALSRQYFQQVKDRYPDSGAARLAEAYLQAEE